MPNTKNVSELDLDDWADQGLYVDCQSALDDLVNLLKHKRPGNEHLPGEYWRVILERARSLPSLRTMVRDLESRPMNPDDSEEAVRRISRVEQALLSQMDCTELLFSKFNAHAFESSVDTVARVIEYLVGVRELENCSESESEAHAGRLNEMLSDDSTEYEVLLGSDLHRHDEPYLADCRHIFCGPVKVSAKKWRGRSATELLYELKRFVFEIVFECFDAEFLKLFKELPPDIVDMFDLRPTAICSRKIRANWTSIRNGLAKLPDNDDLRYLRSKFREEFAALRLKVAEGRSSHWLLPDESASQVQSENAEAASNTETSAGYLEIEVDFRARAATKNGSHALFERKTKPWDLFCELHNAGNAGMSRDDLLRAIWGNKPRQPNNLDQHKRTLNELLEPLGVEVTANNRGIWKLAELSV